MNALTIQKYSKKSMPDLLKLAVKKFHAYIRNRDADEWDMITCIACGKRISVKECHASHFYSAGHHPELRLNEDNVHAGCLRCNYYLSGNLIPYRVNLEKKIGTERLEKLDLIANVKSSFKWDRFSLIDIIQKYK